MSALIVAAAKVVAVMIAVGVMFVGVGVASWKVVYVLCRCRKNPLGKAFGVAALALWIICAIIINLS